MEDLKDQFLIQLKSLINRFAQLDPDWMLVEGEAVFEEFMTNLQADNGLDAGVPTSGGDDLI